MHSVEHSDGSNRTEVAVRERGATAAVASHGAQATCDTALYALLSCLPRVVSQLTRITSNVLLCPLARCPAVRAQVALRQCAVNLNVHFLNGPEILLRRYENPHYFNENGGWIAGRRASRPACTACLVGGWRRLGRRA